jgi:hypothetical protein
VNHDAARARGGVWRPVGFLLLMLGFGLRLDTPWQALGGLLIFAGGLMAGAGLWLLVRRRSMGDAFARATGGE